MRVLWMPLQLRGPAGGRAESQRHRAKLGRTDCTGSRSKVRTGMNIAAV